MAKTVLHLLANAHLDPVWLWDAREGAAEAVSTCRTLVELMRRNRRLTFIRGEAWVYLEVERQAPDLLDEIRALVREGRWDVVGGNWVQIDTNLPATTLFLRQYEDGQRELERLFGKRCRAGWAADTFGQTRGLPEILAASGLKYYAFGRPESWILPLRKPLFFWRGQGGAEILAHRTTDHWYGCERHDVVGRLDEARAKASVWDLENLAVFYGLGDHGGGASQRHVDEITAWARTHPEVETRFSTLHGFFEAAEAELRRRGRDLVDTIDGEINFLQRGYYAAAAKIKFPYRDAEAALRRANLTTAVIGDVPDDRAGLDEAWRALAFNAFHDILPGTAIERAGDEQLAEMGGARHRALTAETRALQRLAGRIDTRVPPVEGDAPLAVPVLVFNPYPAPYAGPVEIEVALDYRPILSYRDREHELPVELRDDAGQPVAFQSVENEHQALAGLPWRRRVVFRTEIPACGWRLFSLGYVEKPATAAESASDAPPAAAPAGGVLVNGRYRVEAAADDGGLRIFRDGQPLFDVDGLRFATYADRWGSWGSIQEEPEAWLCPERVEAWRLEAATTLESGPERARMWCRFAGARSHLEATVSLYRGRDAVDLDLRILWNERATRLRALVGAAEGVEYEVPGGGVRRPATIRGDVPGGRWLVWEREGRRVALASDHLYGFAALSDAYSLTLIRGNRCCTDIDGGAGDFVHRPAHDQGEHRVRLLLSGDASRARAWARELELPPRAVMCDRHAGAWPRRGSLLSSTPPELEILDLREEDGRLRLTAQNQSDAPVAATFNGLRHEYAPWRIVTAAFPKRDGAGPAEAEAPSCFNP